MTRWQDDVTRAEWDEWREIALVAGRRRRQPSASRSAEDYASTAIERLLLQDSRPANVPAWIRLTVSNVMIDAWRASTRHDMRPLSDVRYSAENEMEVFTHEIATTLLGPKSAYTLQESINEVLGFLSEKHQRLILMYAAGFSMEEIAEALGYANRNAVSNQIRRIQVEIQARFEEPYL